MGVGAVTVNGVNLTAKADKDQFLVEFQANRLNGITMFSFKDDHLVVGGSALDIREQHELLVTDDGVRIFGGRIATIEPRLDGGNIHYTGKAVSFDVLLDERVIESGLRDGAGRYDDDDAEWIVGHHSELLATTFVSRLRVDPLPTIDYSGMTLRRALAVLASYTTGPVQWVDQNKQLHWTDPASAQKIVNPGFDGGSGFSWSLDAAAVVTADVGPGGTGDYALVTTGSGSGMKESTETVTGIVAGKRYLFAIWLWSSVASKAQVRLDWQNSSSVSQRIDVITNSGNASTWAAYKAIYTAPATATKVVIRIGGVNNFTGTVRHDNLGLVQESAAWGVDTQPDGVTTYAPWGWREPRRSVQPINRALVRGMGISGWREHAASIAFYGKKFEGVIEDDRVTTADGIDSRAASLFRKYAFPSRSGMYSQSQGGLEAGTWQVVNIRPLNQVSIEWIATLRVYWLGNSRMLYEVVYGDPEEDIAAGAVAAMAAHSDGSYLTPGVPDPSLGFPGADGTAPAVPTGLGLTTGIDTAADGTQYPALVASWNAVGDVDLDAYEGQVDAAIQSEVQFTVSASGTGGSLPAGTYNVAITAAGAVGGETKSTGDKDIVITAGQRIFVNITAFAGAASYKIYASRSGSAPPKTAGQTTTTTGSNVEVTAEGAGATPPLTSNAVAFISPQTFRTATTSVGIAPVRGGVYYAARVRAVDKSGNRSAFTAIVGTTAAPDSTAPGIPTGISAAAGFRLIGVRWAPNPEPDLAAYELRWTTDSAGAPDATGWQSVRLTATSAVITDLTPGTTYYFQVRAIDTSGNVRTSIAVATAVPADANPEAGWSSTNVAGYPYVTAVPSALGSADFAADSIIARTIAADSIDATDIRAGTLSVGGTPDTADFIIVFNSSGEEIGRWDQNGLLIMDPTNTDRRMRFVSGTLAFSNDGGVTWDSAINADGIDASKITFGQAPGGNNSIPNASFELSAFSALLTKVWTLTADWAATIGTNVNLDTSTGDLKATTFTY